MTIVIAVYHQKYESYNQTYSKNQKISKIPFVITIIIIVSYEKI